MFKAYACIYCIYICSSKSYVVLQDVSKGIKMRKNGFVLSRLRATAQAIGRVTLLRTFPPKPTDAMASAMVLFAGLQLAACNQAPSAATNTVQAVDVSKNTAAQPDAPLYVWHEDGRYGYETALSDNDRAAGQAHGKLVLYGFNGIRDRSAQIVMLEPAGIVVAECSMPCEYAKIRTVTARSVGDEQVMPLQGTAMESVFVDAFAGRLQRGAWLKPDGRKIYVWIKIRGYEHANIVEPAPADAPVIRNSSLGQ